MEPSVAADLRVEGEGEVAPARERGRPALVAGEDGRPRPRPLDHRGADEDPGEGGLAELGHLEGRLEGVDLAAVAVAADVEVEGAEGELLGAPVEDAAAEQD